jgi:hypothetical protein
MFVIMKKASYGLSRDKPLEYLYGIGLEINIC